MGDADIQTAAPDPVGSGRARQAASRLAKALVSLAAAWLVARQVEFPELLRVLAGADPSGVVLAAAMYLGGQAVSSHRWRIIAKALGFAHGAAETLRFYFIGMFFNLFGPATVGGDVVRALYLAEDDGRRMVAFNSVFFDRLTGLVMLVMLAVVSLLVFGRFGLPDSVVYVTLAAGLSLVVGWWLLRPVARVVLSPGHRIRRLIDEEAGVLWEDPGLIARVAAWASAFHVWQTVALILVGWSVGVQVPWQYYFVFHPLVTIAGALPLSVAGFGVRELGYVWVLERAGVPEETALALALLWLAVLLFSAAVGGLVYLATGSAMPKMRRG